MANLHSCRFSLKTGNSLPNPPDDVPLFRNLFFPCPEEIAELEGMLHCDFYTLLMRAIGIEKTMSRDAFKGEFFRFLYRQAFSRFNVKRRVQREDGTWVAEEEPVRKALVALVPAIVLFLDIAKCRPGTLDRKGDDYKKISHAVQSIESQIMLECCANLWKKYPKMFLITLHDAIKCLPQDVEKVRAEMIRTFQKYHVSPKFEVKEHKRPDDLNG
jgi:hypothetical protein